MWYFMWVYHGCGFLTSFYNHYGCDHAAHTGITHLWQHLILPSPAQSYSQQVVHHRGRLQADDTIIVVFRNPAQDSITVSLKHTQKDVEVTLSKLRVKCCRRLWVFSKECWILTMDSLMSSNSKASSVFSWGQNRLRENHAQKRWSRSRRREKGKMEKKGIGEDGGQMMEKYIGNSLTLAIFHRIPTLAAANTHYHLLLPRVHTWASA